jgi:hypothetical protein
VTIKSAARLRAPNRRIEGRCLLDDTLHDERELSASRLVAVPHAFRGRSFDPLSYTVPGDSVEPKQGVAAKGNAPRWRRANVGPEKAALYADRGIAGRRERESSEGSPQQRWGWNETSHQGATGRSDGVSNQHRAPAAKASANKKVEACTVGRGESRHSLTAHVKVRVAHLPREHDPPVTLWQLDYRQADRCRGAGQRPQARRTAGDRERGGERR